ncbi:MAG: hypothetical protein QF632_01385 [Candidatus Woesearchaeota archaeon]|jgi:hypothetical protein|nr:hypothetical protein [Candidatus Woesearchaeota archaeon]MDP7323395.1 hypothetical protein [Candidatus Woesearchaeota archaeon]MDP7458211.1 hypothetical protein [Candidatus Woesearchaeota archaeon]
MKDSKAPIIVVLAIIILFLVAFIGFQTLRNNIAFTQQQIYEKGVRDGQLLEQRNTLNAVIQYGYYVIPVVDENNETQQVALGLVQQGPAAGGEQIPSVN